MELILIRHGLPEHVKTDDGSPADPPLSDVGRNQAHLMAEWLTHEDIDSLYTSPMRRAVETAAPLATRKSLDAKTCEGVAEFDRHAGHYIPVEEMKRVDPQRWRRLMRGEIDGADFAEFSKRVSDSLTEIADSHPGETVAVTCHGGVINAFAAFVLSMPPQLFINPDYTSINRFRIARTGQRSLISLNERGHLRR